MSTKITTKLNAKTIHVLNWSISYCKTDKCNIYGRGLSCLVGLLKSKECVMIHELQCLSFLMFGNLSDRCFNLWLIFCARQCRCDLSNTLDLGIFGFHFIQIQSLLYVSISEFHDNFANIFHVPDEHAILLSWLTIISPSHCLLPFSFPLCLGH